VKIILIKQDEGTLINKFRRRFDLDIVVEQLLVMTDCLPFMEEQSVIPFIFVNQNLSNQISKNSQDFTL
jgi:hypothetical protein